MENLIRRRISRRLIWFALFADVPQKDRLAYMVLISLFIFLFLTKIILTEYICKPLSLFSPVASLWIIFVIYVPCLSCFIVCSLQPCGHLLALLPVMFYFVFVTFPCGVLGQVLYLIVSVPDLCLLTYFYLNNVP